MSAGGVSREIARISELSLARDDRSSLSFLVGTGGRLDISSWRLITLVCGLSLAHICFGALNATHFEIELGE